MAVSISVAMLGASGRMGRSIIPLVAADSSGLRLDWWRILDSNFYLQLVTREIDIDNEASGTDPALGLTPDEILLLRRDGDDRRIRLGYRWTDGPHTLQPEITIGEDDRDGGAVAADTSAVQLTYSYGANEWRWVSTAQYFNTDYDAANPVYDRRTDSDGGVAGPETHALLVEVVPLGGGPADDDLVALGGGCELEGLLGWQELVLGLNGCRGGRP